MSYTAHKIGIVGGGSAGWMTAAYLAKTYQGKPGAPRITLVESEKCSPVGVGEASINTIYGFMKSLSVSEVDWMPECNATYKSGILFKDFHKMGESF